MGYIDFFAILIHQTALITKIYNYNPIPIIPLWKNIIENSVKKYEHGMKFWKCIHIIFPWQISKLTSLFNEFLLQLSF